MLSSLDTARCVKRLRLAAPDESRARRGLRLVDDALRTASLPNAAGHLLLVKKLALRFAADVSPQTVSLKFEARIAALHAQAVHATAPDAMHATAVWFRDALEVHALAALRIAARAPLDAWFWPLALPALSGVHKDRQRLRAVLLSQAAREEAPAALPEITRVLVAAGHARELIGCLTDADGEVLLAAVGLPRRRRQATQDTSTAASDRGSSTVERQLAAATGSPANDARVQCVAALLHVADGARVAPPIVRPMRSQATAQEHGSRPAEPDATAQLRSVAAESETAAAHAPARNDIAAQDTITESADAPAQRFSIATAAARARRNEHSPETRVTPSDTGQGTRLAQDPWPAGEPTAAGGLLFLLPVLARLGWVEWLDAAPEWRVQRLERRLFARLCARLALPLADPVWRLAVPCVESDAPASFLAPRCWNEELADKRRAWWIERPAGGERLFDASGRLLLAADAGNDTATLPDAVAEAWLTACRRWLRRRALVGLASLVLRPARLSLTPTHVDLEFDLSAVSLAVRRAGLDIDPGWLPWYGRVVHYRYGAAKWT